MDDKMKIRSAILHILDKTTGAPLLSEELLDLNEIGEYVEKHISRALKDDEVKEIPTASYDGELINLMNRFGQDQQDFIEVSNELARLFYLMISKYDIPSADLLVVDYIYNDERNLITLKMNYKTSYIHYVENNTSLKNRIICQPVSLPSETQKIDEFINYNFQSKKVALKEKKYSLDGVTERYISKYILNIDEIKSPKEKLGLVQNAVETIIEKFYPDDFTIRINTNDAISDSFDKEQIIDVQSVANKVSKGVESVKEEFLNEIKSRGITNTKISLNENLKTRINKKHRLITEDGVEVKLPVNFFNKKDKFEIINNPDGTLSILIKNVEIL